jgi:hypothetical protein
MAMRRKSSPVFGSGRTLPAAMLRIGMRWPMQGRLIERRAPWLLAWAAIPL